MVSVEGEFVSFVLINHSYLNVHEWRDLRDNSNVIYEGIPHKEREKKTLLSFNNIFLSAYTYFRLQTDRNSTEHIFPTHRHHLPSFTAAEHLKIYALMHGLMGPKLCNDMQTLYVRCCACIKGNWVFFLSLYSLS